MDKAKGHEAKSMAKRVGGRREQKDSDSALVACGATRPAAITQSTDQPKGLIKISLPCLGKSQMISCVV